MPFLLGPPVSAGRRRALLDRHLRGPPLPPQPPPTATRAVTCPNIHNHKQWGTFVGLKRKSLCQHILRTPAAVGPRAAGAPRRAQLVRSLGAGAWSRSWRCTLHALVMRRSTAQANCSLHDVYNAAPPSHRPAVGTYSAARCLTMLLHACGTSQGWKKTARGSPQLNWTNPPFHPLLGDRSSATVAGVMSWDMIYDHHGTAFISAHAFRLSPRLPCVAARRRTQPPSGSPSSVPGTLEVPRHTTADRSGQPRSGRGVSAPERAPERWR